LRATPPSCSPPAPGCTTLVSFHDIYDPKSLDESVVAYILFRRPAITAMSSAFLILVGSFSPMISTLNFTSSPPSLSLVSQTPSGTSPSWLLSNPTNTSIIYATDEVDSGALNSLVLDHSSGKLTPVASIPTQGGGPTHIGLVNNGTQLGVANYGGGSAFFTTLDQDLLHFGSPQLVSFASAGSSNAHEVKIIFSPKQYLIFLSLGRSIWRSRFGF